VTDQQVRFAPPTRRLAQITRAEKLLSEIDPSKNYPYSLFANRLTDYRPTSYPDLVIDGVALQHDLCLFMTELAQSIPAMPLEKMKEPVLTLDQMSKRLNVSTKTINRWRQRGLVGLPILTRPTPAGIPSSLVEPFLAANQDRVDRADAFRSSPIPKKRRSSLEPSA